MPKIALTTDGNLYARFFIELGQPETPFDSFSCSMAMSGSYAIDTFNCYTVGEVSSLPNAGTGWNGLWDISTNYSRTIATEFFDYTSGSITGENINNGTGWNNTASIEINA